MEIKTKFAIGDKVWIVKDSKAVTKTVDSIHIYKSGATYSAKENSSYMSIPESQCFATKEELIAYITSDD